MHNDEIGRAVRRAQARDDAERGGVDALIRAAIDAERADQWRKRDKRLARRVRKLVRKAVRREAR